jgi:hypothetical protein
LRHVDIVVNTLNSYFLLIEVLSMEEMYENSEFLRAHKEILEIQAGGWTCKAYKAYVCPTLETRSDERCCVSCRWIDGCVKNCGESDRWMICGKRCGFAVR